MILNKLVNPTSNHQDIISVIVPLIWPEIVRYRGLRAKKEQEFQRKLTMYIAVVNLRIIHQGRVTKILFPCISATTSTFIPATHVADDDSPQSGTVNIGLVLVTGIIDTGPDITTISGICLRQ